MILVANSCQLRFWKFYCRFFLPNPSIQLKFDFENILRYFQVLNTWRVKIFTLQFVKSIPNIELLVPLILVHIYILKSHTCYTLYLYQQPYETL